MAAKAWADRRFELFQNSGLHGPQQLFHFGPGLLDGVKVGRVRRQIEQLRPAAFDELAHPLHLVGTPSCPG